MSARSLGRALDTGIVRLQRTALAAGILGIAGIGIANVLSRNLFGGSLAAAEELSQCLTLVVTFLGLGVAAREARHIRMAAFYDQLRGPARKACWTATAAATSALLFALAWLAVRYVAQVAAIGSVTPALRLPLALVYSVAPLGLALGGLEYALTSWRNLTSPGIHASFDLEESQAQPGAGGTS